MLSLKALRFTQSRDLI